MNETRTSEKEFAVIKEISDNSDAYRDQRIIARNTGISLGLTNLIIKQLITKGYVKALQLNRRKIQYLLTPKGFSEKARKSYNYTVKTINLFKSVKEKLQELIVNKYNSGNREFYIVGRGELTDMIELAILNSNITDLKYTKYENIKNIKENGSKVILNTNPVDYGIKKSRNNSKNTVDIISFLAESGICL